MSNGNGTPILGDRSAFDTVNFPAVHASDIADEAYTVHLPPGSEVGQSLVWNGTGWEPGEASGSVDILAVQIFG